MVVRLQEAGALRPDDPADDQRGDWWDHVAYDPEHKLVLCVVPGARGAENAEAVVADVNERTEGRPVLITSDDYPVYEERSCRSTARR